MTGVRSDSLLVLSCGSATASSVGQERHPTVSGPGKPEAPDDETDGQDSGDSTVVASSPVSFFAELLDAVSVRTAVLVFGVLVLQLGFILSYVGAFHAPEPHDISVAVVAPDQISAQLVDQLNGISGSPLKAHAADGPAARASIRRGDASAALIVNPSGKTDTLLVATGGGTSVASAVEQVVTQVETAKQRTATLTDVVPLQSGDGRGLTGFYLVIGWIVGGYLVAALLGVAKGARPATVRRAVIRLLAVIPYAILSGLGGALVVDQVLDAMTGHFLALWWVGALLVFGAAAVTMAFEVLFGVLGIGVAVLVFVVLGNPSAGGAYQPALLPPFWRTISPALPNGAGTDTVRRIVYFSGHGIAGHLLVLAAYAIAGTAVTLGASTRDHHRVTVDRAAAAGKLASPRESGPSTPGSPSDVGSPASAKPTQ